MMDDKEYIDELNWYTEDFGVETSAQQKEKKTKPSYLTTDEVENRPRKFGHSSRGSRSSRLIDVLENQQRKSEGVSVFNRPVSKVSKRREVTNIALPARKPMFEVPSKKLYDPFKLINRAKEASSVSSSSLKTLTKKSDTFDFPSKTEPVKMPEPISNFVKVPANTKELKILADKLSLIEERDKLIRSSMEKPSNLKQAIAIKGTCPDMCPEKERILRSLKKMVSVFECLPNSSEMVPELAVKEYARSSADQEEPLPHELRPEPVLTMSMSYIITRIITKFEECDDVSVWYDFCWNRLRAIRKDIVQQQLCDMETVTIVEQCSRFHIVCFDRFWGLDSSVFDEKINTENLMNCLKILLNLYGDLRKQGITCPNEPEFNAYMILLKMNSGDILWEFLNFPLSLQQTPEVIEAVKIHMFYNSNMYSQFFNYLVKTTYLNACLMQRCFTMLRVKGLEAMVKAYCPPGKEGKVSLQHIMKSLKFDNKDDTLAFCRACNIRYIERVGFKISHTIFIRPENPLRIKTPSSLVCNKRVDFAEAVVGLYNDMPIYTDHIVHNSFLDDKTLSADALDASDQEEKMLRDNVERKLIMKSIKNSPVKEGPSNVSFIVPSTPPLQRSLSSLSNRRKSTEPDTSAIKLSDTPTVDLSFAPEPEDVEMDELSDSEDYDMPDAIHTAVLQTDLSQTEGNDNVVMEAETEESLTSDNDSEMPLGVDSDQVSPLSAISDDSEVEEIESILSNSSHAEKSSSPEPAFQFSLPAVVTPKPTTSDTPVSIEHSVSPTLLKSVERRTSVSSQKESQINPYIIKLKNKLRLNLQRISAKKYGRIWREKVREIKKSYGFIPLVSHMNLREYLNVWGHSVTKHYSIWNHLNNSKKLSSSVDSLLLFNLFDTSVKRLGHIVCEILIEKKLRDSLNHTSLPSKNQCGPIYWKLVFSVPTSKQSCYDLYEEITSWSEQVFFTSEVARNTHIETSISKGVKVHCKVTVSEGTDKVDCARNMSALVMLRVPGWETLQESQNRLNKLLTLSNHPIPVCVINLTSCNSPLSAPTNLSVIHFDEVTASSKSFCEILTKLASNSYQLSVKSLYVCDLMNGMIDHFLDALQEDRYHSDDFSVAISDPSNIIYLYNILIDKIKNELIENYRSNIFGTANEIIASTTTNSKYKAGSLSIILSDYFNSLILSKLRWPPDDSKDVLYILKNYCDKSGIPQVLSHVIRMINPPDLDNLDQPLSAILNQLNWLQIMEVIVKGYFRTKFCDVVITYSEKAINDLIDSHWWMECGSILKYSNV